uniref:Uncharacterized protein n=1 Tax=Tetraodon nigroviridis TaxID=99883 RepID=H3BZB5_TETNG
MLLWLLFLLVGCVVAAPVQKAGVGGSWFYPRSLSELPPQYAASSWFSPDVSQQMASSQTGGDVQSPQPADWSYQMAGPPEQGLVQPWVPGSDGGYSEMFFTDTSGLTPVYTHGSRSRYRNGRVVFAQTRYIPGEPVY